MSAARFLQTNKASEGRFVLGGRARQRIGEAQGGQLVGGQVALDDPALQLVGGATDVESPPLAALGDVNERTYGQTGVFGPLVRALRDDRVRTHGLRVNGYCRGGMFPAADAAGRSRVIDDNRRAIDDAATIGAR